MARPSDNDPGKKPFIALTGKAVVGWVVVIFVISGWMFGVGVMVGRGTAPIAFDLDQLKRTLESLQKSALPAPKSGPQPPPSEMKNKTELGFYESLPKSREDTEIPNIQPPPSAARPEPTAAKPATPPPVKAEKPAAPAPPPTPAPAPPAAGKPFTVQVAAVKSEEEARQLAEKLRQRGYAAYIEPTAIPDKGTWYRVRMGEFPAKEFARSTMERLQKDGFSPNVVPK